MSETLRAPLARSIVERHVVAWDPYGLIAGGAPIGEFDPEVDAICARLGEIRSEPELVGLVSAVFSRFFGPGRFAPNACAEIGSALFAELARAGLVTGDGG